jgi:tetratricopeptide (TPR) repeat protein
MPSNYSSDKTLNEAIRAMIAGGRYDDAIDRLRFACKEAEAEYGPWHPKTVSNKIALTDTLMRSGDLDGASLHVDVLLSGLMSRNEGESLLSARARARAADVAFRQSNYEKADQLAESAVDGLARHLTDTHPEVLEARVLLGCIRNWTLCHGEARTILESLVALYDAGTTDGIDILATTWALVYNAVGERQFADAERYARRALESSIQLHGRRHKATAKAMTVLAMALRESGKDEYALNYADRAIEIFRENREENLPSADAAKVLAMTIRGFRAPKEP